MRISGLPFVGAVTCLGLLPAPAPAQERLVRSFPQEHGLTAPPVWSLAQDSIGFLWIGAEGGLFRFDGTEIRRWAPETIDAPVGSIAVSPAGRIVAVDVTGAVHEVLAAGARPLELPFTGPTRRPGYFESVAFDRDGTIWLTYGDTVAHRPPVGDWHVREAAAYGGGRPRFVRPTAYGGVLLGTDSTLWRVRRNAPPQKLFQATALIDAIEPDSGRIVVVHHTPDPLVLPARVVEVRGGVEREVAAPSTIPPGRAVAIHERNGTIWLSLDRFLISIREGERPEVLGREAGVESGGPLLVDHEGSLWHGSYLGIHQYPEPDTRLWAEAQGLPSRHARFVARTGPAVWIATWGGTVWVRQDENGWAVGPVSWSANWDLCADGRGAVWASTGDSLVEIRDTIVTDLPGPAPGRLHGCTPAPAGGVWFGTEENLLFVEPGGRRVRVFPHPEVSWPGAFRRPLLHDRRDRLWVSAGDGICGAQAAEVLRGVRGAWRCAAIPAAAMVTGMVELPDGRLWASSNRRGLFVREGDEWRPQALPPNAATRTIQGMAPSPRGGVWLVGSGLNFRVDEGEDGELRVLERLTPWHGLGTTGVGGIDETEDGDLWLATNRGLVQVPAPVRFTEPAAPPIALVEAWIDDVAIPLDAPLVLPHDRNRLELRFAALSFRERSRIRHQVRLGPDEAWSESTQPSFRWVDLRSGAHQVEYRASLDGLTWPAEPILFAFTVRPPWYATPWFGLLVLSLAGTLVWAGYRARVAYLLGLERQRTRIAMDLHDEVGSGLASVGILSGVLAHGEVEEAERRRTATEIAAAADDLGTALADIVWSLDPRAATMEELAARLAEHGERLCAHDEFNFTARFPERWPDVRPDVQVRRNVLLIGFEALHNASRHARAREVILSLCSEPGGAWVLRVVDDGVGLATADGDETEEAARAPRPGTGSGRGLPGMRRRAAEIGARITIHSEPGHGTRVTLRFRPERGGPGRAAAVADRLRLILGRARMNMRVRPRR